MDVEAFDKRFQSVFYDHRFRSIKQKQKKIKIDRRFLPMFTDEKFKLQYHVDKRGRPVHETTSENLKKYYRISNKERKRIKQERKKKRNRLSTMLNDDEESNNLNVNHTAMTTDKTSTVFKNCSSDESSKLSEDESESESDDEESEDEIDLARGEGNIESSSEDDDDDVDDENIEMLANPGHSWDQLDNDAQRSEEGSKRLALCNMNWDRIKADDLMVLFNGFKPTGGAILKVSIYPSEFGLKRMEEENKHGPVELTGSSDFTDDKEAERMMNEKIREHQLNRLKYYYAVIECDSIETAEAIYKDCDGIEYESSSAKLDLRFIPDEMVFNDQTPKDTCDHIPDKDQYKHSSFVTTALNQAKVNLTWEEGDHNRVKMLTRKYTEADLADMDMKDFLASSSDEDEEEDDNNDDTEFSKRKIGISSRTTDQDQIARYKSLLLGEMDGGDDGDKSDDVDMEITFEPTLDELDNSEKEDDDDEDDNEIVSSEDDNDAKNNIKTSNNEMSKSKKKKRRKMKEEEEPIDPMKKAELEMLMLDAEDAKLKHFDMTQIMKDEKMSKKKKRKLGKPEVEDDFKLNMDDSRFSAIFTSSVFALDPNNPAFRKTKAMKELVEERQQRVHGSNPEDEIPSESIRVVPDEIPNPNLNKKRNVDAIKLKAKQQFEKKKSKKALPKLNKKST